MALDNGFEAVATVDQIPAEGVLAVVRSDGQRVCLIRSNDKLSAVADNCTHQDFEMALGDVLPDGTIQCAWHGARFDCATGEVRQGPATSPLPVFEVKLDGNRVLVGASAVRSGVGEPPCAAMLNPQNQ
jgi:3-phenylpropionate/trans-cinnamate dioxygenase ferredoxin component